MVNFLKHQKTIGIVGSGPDVDTFIETANRLGYFTSQLIRTKDENFRSKADQLYQGLFSDPTIQEEFLMTADYLVYFDLSIFSYEIAEAEKSLLVPQGEELLSIAQDRSLQKAFYESIGVNIAPYEMIVTEDDITEALPSLGYPAVLRKNVVATEEALDSYFIYEEADIKEASEFLEAGPAVLESWIVSEHQLAITVLKENNGNIQLYPVVKKHFENERLAKISPYQVEDPELAAEIEKVAKLIAQNIAFVGVISIEFIVSPAHALYLGEIHPYPNDLSRYTEGHPMYSSVKAHLAAISSLPVAEIQPEKVRFSYHPLYADQQEKINQALIENGQGIFHFDPAVKTGPIDLDDEIGYYLTDEKEWTL